MDASARTLESQLSHSATDWWRFLIILTGLVVITHIPLILSGFPRGHDAAYHLKWLYHFSTQLTSGDAYPRWLNGMSGGLGGPSFYYYPPASYYVSSFFSLFIDPLSYGHHVLAATAIFAAVIGAVGLWMFCRPWLTERACLFAIVVFLVLPYRLVVDLYMRGDIAELFGMSVIPWLFLASTHLGQSTGRILFATSMSTALIVLTHPLVAMIALPFAFLFRLLDAMWSRQRKRLMIAQLLATGLGIALSAFYILPALLVENPAKGGWDLFIVYDSFLFDRPLSPVPVVAAIGLAAILTSALLAVLGWALVSWMGRQWRVLALFFLMNSAVAAFMLFEVSAPVYRLFSALERLQFPWRYTTILTVIAAIALAFVFDEFRRRSDRVSRSGVVVLLLLSLAWLVIGTAVGVNRSTDGFNAVENRLSIARSHDAPEYRLSTLSRELPSMPTFDGFDQVLNRSEETVVVEWTEDAMELAGEFNKGEPVKLGRQFFGNWQLLSPSGEPYTEAGAVRNVDGLITVAPLEHTSRLRLVRSEFTAVVWGERISTAALLVLAILLLAVKFLRFSQTSVSNELTR